MLMVHELDYRFRATRFGPLFTLLEPFAIVLIIIAFRSVFRGRLPAFGTSNALFYSTGIFAFYVYLRLSSRGRGQLHEPRQRLPRTTSLDYIIAGSLVEAALIIAMMIVWFASLWAYGIQEASPRRIVDCIVAVTLLGVLGIGVGLINAAISIRIIYWRMISLRLTGRGLMFVSGVFFIVDFLPIFIRDIVVWIPLVHGIEWFRLGIYGSYPTFTLDRWYLVACAFGAFFIGIILHGSSIRYRA